MADDQNKILESGSESILFAHKAFKFIENQQYDEALSICEEGVKCFPFYAEGHFILGKCYQTVKKYDDAKNEYERTLVFMPGHIRALNALAYIYHKMDLAPKANDLLIQASLYNPFNTDLIGYLKAENLYDGIYSASGAIPASSDIQKTSQQSTAQSDLDIDIEDDVTRELISEINDLVPESSHESVPDVSSEGWDEEADNNNADELVAYNLTDDELDDSSLSLEDSEIAEIEKESISDLKGEASEEIEFNIDSDQEVDESLNIIESELNDIAENDLQGSDQDKFDIEDSTIDDSFLDDSFISDSGGDEFYLESEDTDEKDTDKDEEITRIDKFASSKDEITESSIEQYEVNNIVNNIVESDSKDDTKTDLSQFANTEDDFSSLMNGIFEERDLKENEEEFDEDSLDDFDEDETQMAEERPILDTSIVFMDKEKPKSLKIEDQIEESDTQISDTEEDLKLLEKEIDLESDENEDSTLDDDEEDIEFDNINLQDQQTEDADLVDDEISMMIEEIEKKGDKLISQDDVEEATEVSDQPRIEALPAIEDENASIDEILNNPKMLTPTFGEILIAQKKFRDAQRVFTELTKKDPNNNNLKRKIEFLNKLVKFEK